MVRWETLVRLVNKTENYITPKNAVQMEEISVVQSEIVPVTQDKNLEQSLDKKIVTLIEDLARNPTIDAKNAIIQEIKNNPSIFGMTGHEGFISSMMNMSSLVQQKNSVINSFLFELWPLVKGPNLFLVKQLLAINFNDNMVNLLDQLGASSRDPVCSIGEIIPDSLEKEEKEAFFNERRSAFDKIANDESLPARVRTMSINCFRVSETELLKLNPPAPETPQEATAPAQAPTP